MRKLLVAIFLVFGVTQVDAQELNATVTIDAEQSGQPNAQVFRTLKTQLVEFLNNTRWTNREYKNQERIDCNFTLIVTEFESTNFSGSLQIQSSRPVFGSTYDTPVYNYNDRQVSFEYSEFQPMVFNINNFDSNLMSIIAYHVYTVIGLDADTFALEGGKEYFDTAKQIVNTAAGSNFAGWKATDGTQSRFRFNDAVISNVFREFHSAMYDYHRHGLDNMSGKPTDAKLNIINAIEKLKTINDKRPNSFILRTFFDAKGDELSAVFSGGPRVGITDLVDMLNRIAPTKRSNWNKIKL